MAEPHNHDAGTGDPAAEPGPREAEPRVINAGEDEADDRQADLFAPEPASQREISPDSAGVKP